MRILLGVELYLIGLLFLGSLIVAALKGFTIRRTWEICRDGVPELAVSIWKWCRRDQ